jgi:hypothetical protein
MSYSGKSMITNAMIGYEYRSMINPVSGSRTIVIGSGGSGGSGANITLEELQALYVIQELYTLNLANKTYENIPTNLTQYLQLRTAANAAKIKYASNPALAVLFQITVDSITGAINAYGLNALNVQTQVQNTYLQNTIQEIINGVNVAKAFGETTGTFSMGRNFDLAPLFRYYISLYGVPIGGEGFNPDKLTLVLLALQNSGIDPYNG